MWLTDVAIKRPVFITVFFIALFVLGYRSLTMMPVDLFPDVDIPIVSVVTIYAGAGPEEIENLVTKPIEDQVGAINKIDELISISRDSMSSVLIKFKLEADIDVAAADVRDKVDLAKADLPDDAEDPQILKLDLGAIPVLSLGVTSDSMEIRELKTLIEQIIADRIAKIGGVGNVNVSGGETREILINVDQKRLEAYSMTIEELRSYIQMANLNIPGGNVRHGNKENSIRVFGEFQSVDEIKNLKITKKTGNVTTAIKLSDIADVIDGSAEQEAYTRLNLENSVGLEIQKQADANTLKVVELVKEELEKIKKDYPHLSMNISEDQSLFIEQSLEDIREELLFGGLLAVLIVFLFLHDLRSTFIIATALPTSMMSIFIILNAAGQSINMMTLMGLALSTGILIDDSIVILENIHRHLKMGKPPKKAAYDGRTEIGLAAIAITMVDVVVYLPIAFMGGIVGRFFFAFGLTAAMATLFSLLTSFTLTPMLASRFFKQEKNLYGLWFDINEKTKSILQKRLTGERLYEVNKLMEGKLSYDELSEKLKEEDFPPEKINMIKIKLEKSWTKGELESELHVLGFNQDEIKIILKYCEEVRITAQVIEKKLADLNMGEEEIERLLEHLGEEEAKSTFTVLWHRFFGGFDSFYDGLDYLYRKVLEGALKVRWLVVLFGIGSLILTLFLIAPHIGFEFMNQSDEGRLIIKMELPSDSNVEETDRFIRDIEEIINNKEDFPEILSLFTTVGAEPGFVIGDSDQGPQYAAISIDLGDKKTRTRSTEEIRQIMQKKLAFLPYRITVITQAGMGGSEAPVQVEITGSKYQMDDIISISEKVAEIVKTTEGTMDINTSWKEGKPETRIIMDRLKAADMDYSVSKIGGIVRTSIEGNDDIKYREFGEEYDIRVRLKRKDRKEPEDVKNLYIGDKDGKPVYIKNIAKVITLPAPNKINRKDKQRLITITAVLQEGYPLGNVKSAIEARIAKELTVPAGISITFGGEGKRMMESFQYMIEALLLAVILVYLVMCGLFESYLNPFIIMFALPQAIVGGLLALFITGKTLTIFSMIGIIMLMGLVGKNAILLIDYTNTLRFRGMERDEAIKEAGPTRLRPILMTTMAMIFGMLPVALGLGSGSEMRQPMSIALIGGLTLSTLLTLLVIPVLYAQFDDFVNFMKKHSKIIKICFIVFLVILVVIYGVIRLIGNFI